MSQHQLYQSHFTPEEFEERRSRVFDAIGPDGIGVLQGAPRPESFDPFRQTNEFFYLCGVEVAHAYLQLDSRERQTTLYLPGHDDGHERSEGPVLHSDDPETVLKLTGVDAVKKPEDLEDDLKGVSKLFVTQCPSEGARQARDTLHHSRRLAEADPWNSMPAPEKNFIATLKKLAPSADMEDLSPLLDSLRLNKSTAEIEMMRYSGKLTALAVVEAMRSTRPGQREYQLEAAADYVYRVNGARGAGYCAIIAGGTNIWHGHYNRNDCELLDGDLVLMDYAPDFGNYTSDIGRMWPVNGKYSDWQRELYGFIVEYHKAVLNHLRPNVTAKEIMDDAAADMKPVVDSTQWSKPSYEEAARKALEFQGHLSHPVGMAVHDVGRYREEPLIPGLVISIDPSIWVPDEQTYVRVEDTIVITEDGHENFTDLAPLELNEVETTIQEQGIVEKLPPIS